MPSPLSSALANLDNSLRSIQSQLTYLGAALEVDDAKINRSLRDGRQHAAMLRNLVRAERPAANWSDRGSLERLILDLEAAAEAARNRERRTRLVDLASQLEAGKIKHRFDSRATVLDAMRLDAMRELLDCAQSTPVNELAGPTAAEWLHWACGLRETSDTPVLAQLRRDFPALERFASQMEETYWIPAQVAKSSLGAEPLAAPANAKRCDRCHCTFPLDFKVCPFDNSALRAISQAVPATLDAQTRASGANVSAGSGEQADVDSGTVAGPEYQPDRFGTMRPPNDDPANWELAKLQAIIAERKSGFSLEKLLAHKNLLAACGAVAAIILVAAFFYVQGVTPKQWGASVIASGAKAAGFAEDPVPDAEIQRYLNEKLPSIEDSAIQATVKDGVVTLVGHTLTKWDLLHAESVASHADGVKLVNNQLEVVAGNLNAAKGARRTRQN